MIEIRPLPGYEELYGITPNGDVWAYPKTWVSGNNRECSHLGKWLNKRPDKNGYLKVMLCSGGRLKHIAAHRLVAITYIPNPEDKPQVNHKDGIKTNNFVDNLEWATNAENQRHAYAMGLNKGTSGEQHGMAKLKRPDIIEIYRLRTIGLTHKQIAANFPVARQTISRVLSGELWKERTR